MIQNNPKSGQNPQIEKCWKWSSTWYFVSRSSTVFRNTHVRDTNASINRLDTRKISVSYFKFRNYNLRELVSTLGIHVFPLAEIRFIHSTIFWLEPSLQSIVSSKCRNCNVWPKILHGVSPLLHLDNVIFQSLNTYVLRIRRPNLYKIVSLSDSVKHVHQGFYRNHKHLLRRLFSRS